MVQLIEDYPVVVSLVATFVVVVITVWAARRWGGNRSTQLRVAWDSTRMVATQTSKELEIRLSGAIVREPYLVNVTMHDAGPNDIFDSSFDRSRPLKVTVRGASIVDVVDPQDGAMPQTLSDDGRTLLIGPGLLSAEARHSMLLFTEGEVAAIEFGDLVNVDMRHVSMQALGDARKLTTRESILLGLTFFMVGVTFGVLSA